MSSETKKNIIKASTDTYDAIAENLDNTAPYKTIIASIDAKRRKEKTLINYINSTVRRKHYSSTFSFLSDFLLPSQSRNSFAENWDGGLNSGFFEADSLKSLKPWMITKVHDAGKPDPVTDTLHKRHDWNNKWTIFKICYAKNKKSYYKWFDDDVIYCPKSFPQMAALLVNKPDQFFDDDYNWYYAGKGNMLVACLDGSDYLIHSERNCLYMSPFFKDNLSIDYTNTATYACTEGSHILETVHSQNVIALRTKCKVIILKIVTSEVPLQLERVKEIDSELPFTSITFDEFHKNILYVTTLDCQLTMVNLDRMVKRSKKLRGKFKTLVDNWSCVISAERGCYAHVTKQAITLYDKRTNEPFQRYKNFRYITDIQTCNKISAVKYCERKPLLYVGNNLHLFLVDMRCGKTKNDNITPVQRWTHGMISTPTYIDICNYDQNNNKEMVCLSSQWFEDMCIVSNYSDRLTRTGEISGLTIPFRPPSIMQTYNEAQRMRLCCNLDKSIHHRLCTSITGLAMVDQKDTYSILMQNSLGDISCHNLYPEHMFAFIEDDSIERLHEWSNHYVEEKKPFEVSHVIDIQLFLKYLCRVPDDFILGRNTVIKPRVKFNENEIYETYAKELLDPELLEIWKEKDDEILLDKTGLNQFFVDI